VDLVQPAPALDVSAEADVGADAPVLLAIDGNSLVHRSFHAQARTGLPSWAVRGLLMQLVAAVERIRPAAVVVGFDDPHSSVRRDRWPTYKAQRGDKLESLVEQLAVAVEVMRELGLAVVVPAGLEADDVLAAASSLAGRLGMRTVVVTSDRDAFALIDDTTRVLRIINGGVDASPLMTADRLELLVGIRPHQYRDFAALRGDPSDNLPGVRGIGPATAARVLQCFGTARAAFDDLDAVRREVGAGVAGRLAADGARAAWALNCEVMAFVAEVAVDLDPARGPGVMPLAADAVHRAYHRHNLTWTAKDAMRVLAEVEAPAAPPVRASMPAWVDGGGGYGRPKLPKLPKLPPRKPVAAQLSLFD
jgi:5'-3' exonuclease